MTQGHTYPRAFCSYPTDRSAAVLQWLNPDGMGGDVWIPHPLQPPSHVDEGARTRARRATTSYNGVAAVNETHGAFTFDMSGDLYAVPFSLA